MTTSMSVDDNAAGKALLCVTGIFWLMATVTVGLRVVAARRKQRPFGAHDHFIFVAVFFAAVLLTCFFIQVFLGGVGLPQNKISPEAFIVGQKVQPLVRVSWSISNTCVKLSFTHLFATLFSLQKHRRRLLAAAAVSVAFGLGIILMVLLVCQPYEFFWDKTIPGGHCGRQSLGLILEPVFNLATDLIIFLLPVPILWKLQGLSRWKRGKLIMTMWAVGSLLCCITFARIFTAVHLTTVQAKGSPDGTYWVGVNAILLGLEPCLGIIAACIPTLQPLCSREDSSGAKNVSPQIQRLTMTVGNDFQLISQGRQRLNDLDMYPASLFGAQMWHTS